MEKRCTKCKIIKPLEVFSKYSRSSDGHMRKCKACVNIDSAVYRKTEERKRYIKEYNQRPEYKKLIAKREREKSCEFHLLKNARVRAKKRGLEFNLTLKDIIVPEVCPLLGIPLKRGNGAGGYIPNSPSLDRKDASKGYTRDNIWVISWRANCIKYDATTKELKLILQSLIAQGV